MTDWELWEKYRLYCYKIVNKFSFYRDKADLQQESYLAVVEAKEHYNPDKGAFITILTEYLYKRLYEYVYKDIAVHVPRNLMRYVNRYRAEEIPSKERIIEECNITEGEADCIIKALQWKRATSLNSIIKNDDADTELGDLIADKADTEQDAVSRTENEELRAILDEVLKELPENEAEVIRLRYYYNLDAPGIAAQLGVEQSEIAKIERRAMRKLRQWHSRKRLQPFLDSDLYSEGLKSSLSSFKNTWQSSTEKEAFKLFQAELRRRTLAKK